MDVVVSHLGVIFNLIIKVQNKFTNDTSKDTKILSFIKDGIRCISINRQFINKNS